ncbi:hypothetical protein [Clostridium sp. D43t1_170807_H7]|uniref:hypothetical protein n=1 Tax=Clostridium sp. D43t1_170807_H7 TaxID=2787140 RepID=UPI001899193E|nr:hypothetical protein [Clostridium sp. D43t1_170807_H7]
MKKIIAFILILLNIGMVMCSSNDISKSDIKKIKEIVDKVLSYDRGYDEEVSDYIKEEVFNKSKYVIFYNYYIEDVILNKYESEVLGASKDDGKYNVCLVINMEAQSTVLETDGLEQGYDTAEGINVPVEVVLRKNNREFYIESIKEYDSLEIAKKENKNFLKNK